MIAKTLGIGTFGKGRLWVDEDVEAGYSPIRVLERHLLASRASKVEGRVVAVEVYLPRGARAEYGLIGMRYEPTPGRELLVRVLVGDAQTRKYEASLAGQVDEVRVGLPAEYAQAVLEATCDEASEGLAPGIVTIDRAAHGRVGSSMLLFDQLARLVVRVLAAPVPSEDQIRNAFGP